MKKYNVLRTFADKNNMAKRYNPGDELPGTFGEDRLANIVAIGLAKVVDAEAGKGNGSGDDKGAGNTVTDIDLTGKAVDIVALVKGFSDVEKLTQYLETEQSSEKPRQTVVKAIEDRLANIVKE